MKQSHLRAMQDGRERAKRKRDREGVKRVKEYRAFLRADRLYWEALTASRTDATIKVPRKPQFAMIPTAADYDAAREAGL